MANGDMAKDERMSNRTITNILPDQTVTITGGTNIQIFGTYPNFGVNFTGSTGGGQYLPLSGGTVTGGTILCIVFPLNNLDSTCTLGCWLIRAKSVG